MKKTGKPLLEKIAPSFGSSFTLRTFNDNCQNADPFWHFHPEIELVYVGGGNGKRHIGKHLSYFRNGDLVLLGSNLPHYGFTDRLTGNESEIVVQFKSNFLGTHFFQAPEILSITNLFERAKMGIVFKGKAKLELGNRLKKLEGLNRFERLLELLDILKEMAQTPEFELLNVQDSAIEIDNVNSERISKTYAYIRHHFHESIPLEDISQTAGMTVPAFCRYFKKHSGKTFTQFVNEYRIVHACKLLSESTKSISEIAIESGFNNFSHFNKQFNKITGKKASEYRNDFKQVIT